MAAFGGTGALVTGLCLAPPFLAQCLLARRFLATREEDADLRAMQTLDPADAQLLTTRKPEGWGPTGDPAVVASDPMGLAGGRPHP